MFDGVFDDLIKDKSSNDKELDNKTVGEQSVVILDPRPDLCQDTIFWQQMLASAKDRDPTGELYAALLYMRAKGTLFFRRKNSNGKVSCVLRPYINPLIGWASIGEYEREKRAVFDPVRDRLIELLKDM